VDEFTRTYEAHASRLLAFFARRTFDPQVSLDLVGETFARAYAGRTRRRALTPEAQAAWLYGIARRVLAEYWRRGSVERRALARLCVEPPTLTDESFARIDELAGSASLREAIATELVRLPAAQQEALRLKVVEERSYLEVALALGVSEEAARARVSRGLRALHTRLREAPA